MTKNTVPLDKEAELARMLKLPEETVRAARIPGAMLNDLFNRASEGTKFAKYLRNPGAALAVAAVVIGVPAALIAGSADPEPLRGAIKAMAILIYGVQPAIIAGCFAIVTGMVMDDRRSVRKTVNELAMGRLAELDQKDRGQAPTPQL